MTAEKHESDRLIEYLKHLQPLSDQVAARIKTETFKVSVRKNDILPCVDQLNGDYLFFVIKGLLRSYIVDEGKDITAWLTDEDHLIGSIRNPAMLKPTYEEKFQALEDSELLILPYRFIDALYEQFPETNILARKILAINYHISQERSVLSRIPSAEARYRQFKNGHPTMQHRVPLKYLASYLGIRIETLSRIRKKEKQEGKD